MNDQGLEPFVPRLLRVGDQIKIGEAVFTFAVYDGTARLFGQVSYTDNEPVVLPTSFASKTSAQPSLAPLELPTYEPAPRVQKQPRKYGKVKGRWISILIVVGLIATFLLTGVSIVMLTQPPRAIPLAPKLVVLHHQFYNRPMQGGKDLGYPTPLPGRDSTYSFPDPLHRGTVTYHTAITNVTKQGTTFLMDVKFAGKTYHYTISGVKTDDGIQIQLSNKQNNAYIATPNEAQLAVDGASVSMITGEVVVWMHFTYQQMWHWQDATQELWSNQKDVNASRK